MRGNSKGRYTFLMLAGVYLLYLCWQLIKGFRSGEATSPVFLIAAVVFFIAGILVIVSNIRQILKISDEEAKANTENGDTESADIEASAADAAADNAALAEEESKKEPSAPKRSGASLFDRAGLGAVSDAETADESAAETNSEHGDEASVQ